MNLRVRGGHTLFACNRESGTTLKPLRSTPAVGNPAAGWGDPDTKGLE
jgi:hypothetical protein